MDKKIGIKDSSSIKFLFEEFRERNKYWQHVDKKNEGALKFYWGLITFAIPALTFIYRNLADQQLRNISIILLLCIIICSGLMLINRYYKTDKSIWKNDIRINLIKQYFINNEIALAEYLDVDVFEYRNGQETMKSPQYHPNLTFLVIIFNGVLIFLGTIRLYHYETNQIQFNCCTICVSISFTLLIIILVSLIYIRRFWFSDKLIQKEYDRFKGVFTPTNNLTQD